MKRKMWKRLASLALATVLTVGLVPGARAAGDNNGAVLSITGSATGTAGQYAVTYSASLKIADNETSQIVSMVSAARVNKDWLKALRFTCYLEDELLRDALTESDLEGVSLVIAGTDNYVAVSTNPVKTANGVSATYRLTDAAVDELSVSTLSATQVAEALAENMSITFTDTLTNSEVYSAVGSASFIPTTGYILVTCDETMAENNGFNADVSLRVAEATCTTTISPTASGGSSSGGSSSGGSSSGNKTETVTNPDGSTTTTVTKPNGTVTETTKWPDGSKEVVESKNDGTTTTTATDVEGNVIETVEKADGTSTTTVDNKDGSASTTTVNEAGKVESEVTLPEAVIDAAKEKNETITLPMPSVTAGSTSDDAPVVTVNLPADSSAKIAVPVNGATYGTVVVQVNNDGTEEIVVNSIVEDNRIIAVIADSDKLKIVDNSKDFIDVPDEHWGEPHVDFITSRELLNGTSSNMFSPELDMSRAMMLTVLARYEGVDTTGGATWYEQGVEWAVKDGVSDGTNLDAALSREQLATMLWRYVGSPAVEKDLSAFADSADISDWAKEAMMWAVDAGLITGTDLNTLNPQASASRVEVAAILARFVVAVTLANG